VIPSQLRVSFCCVADGVQIELQIGNESTACLVEEIK